MSATCRNCGEVKTPAYYSENYCKTCTDALDKATAEARKNDADAGAARREALAQRAHSAHNNHISPRRPLTRGDYWNAAHPGTEPTL